MNGLSDHPNALCKVVLLRQPAKMLTGHTSELAVMARMGCFIFGPRRWAIEPFTDKAMDVLMSAVLQEMPIAAQGARVRPNQAFVGIMGEYRGTEKIFRLSLKRAATERVAVAFKALGVRSAKTFGQMFAAATFNGALQLRPSTKQRIAVLSPALVMHAAPASAGNRLAAIGNRAYSWGSHSEPPVLRFGQNPLAALVTLGGFAFCTAVYLKIQGVQK